MNNESTIEPSLEFCWSFGWRLIILTALIGALPLAVLNLCLWVIGQEVRIPFENLVFFVTNFLILNCAVSFSLKMLLSKGVGRVTAWFQPKNT